MTCFDGFFCSDCPFTQRSFARKPGTAATGRSSGQKAASATFGPDGKAFLNRLASTLARLAQGVPDRGTLGGRPLASQGVQALLEMDLATWDQDCQKTAQQGTPRTDLPHGCGEPNLGAPRIHGELKMLGFDLSERTVLRWMRKASRSPEPARQWTAFLSNHREAIAAMDLFTMPTLTFGVLYCFFVIAHDRRRVVHFNATKHPTSPWIVQQLREAFPCDAAPHYLIFDRSANFGDEVVETIRCFGIQPKRTSFQSPWQNSVAKRFVGSCRLDLLDHFIVLNERHLKRLMNEYVRYYHEDRTHLGLEKQTPAGRTATIAARTSAGVVSMPRLGSMHHRYDIAA